MRKASRAERLACELDNERENDEQSIMYAFFKKWEVSSLTCRKIEDSMQDKNIFQLKQAVKGEHVAVKQQDGSAYIFTECGTLRGTQEHRWRKERRDGGEHNPKT